MREAIAEAYRAAREAWPDVLVEQARFAAELERRLGVIDPGELRSIATADLYLAIACLDADPAAIAHLERDYLTEIDFAARKLRAPNGITGDVRGHLLRVLFTGEPGRAAALAQFSGKAKLKDYLRVIATRELTRALQKKNHESPIDPLLDRLQLDNAPEVELIKNRHGAEVSAALRSALAELDERQRALLRYSVVEGWTVDQIGAAYGVHRATAARWTAAARDRLASLLRRKIAAHLEITADDVDSIVRVVQSRIDVSLERIL